MERSAKPAAAAPRTTSPADATTDGDAAVLPDLLAFLDASPTPWHAVEDVARRLRAHGFERLDARAEWSLVPGRGYYATKGDASIVAFRLGAQPPAVAGYRLLGAHTDSPGLRLKPRPAHAAFGHALLDVEVYGGAILATWADRDLAVAGRVVVDVGGRTETRLVRSDGAVARIPTLAIHLDREVNDRGLRLDRHAHLSPTVGLADARHATALVDDTIASLARARPGDVRGFDLCLVDAAPAAIGGFGREFVFSSRLDDLAMCHAAVTSLLRAAPGAATPVACLFDHEEVGSESAEGAASTWLRDLLGRVSEAHPAPGGLGRALAGSLLVSADMAHAIHPNHPDRHDGDHAPRLNGGPVLKSNAGRRYTTDAETGAFFRGLCDAVRAPHQEFAMRSDLPCGSTIGPIVAARLGTRAVDVGNAMLSMHSVREMAGAEDPAHMTRVFARFLAGIDPLPA